MALHTMEGVAVEDEGDGEAVICLHGLGGTSNTWQPLMPALAGWRVLRPDLPGSGRSGRAGDALSIAALAACVATVCQRLAISRAHVLGHSMGTIVAQHLALAQPRLVRSLALFGPLLAPAEANRAGLRARADQAGGQGQRGMRDIAQALLQSSLAADTHARQPAAVAFVRESLLRQDPQGYGRSCAALAEAQPAAVEGIECPVLLVTGDEDRVAPPQAVRAMAERFRAAPALRTVVLSRCGHWTPIERPEDCARELRSFLSTQR